jgi:geranylgeranyl pyrophosphate synthase
MDRLKDFFIEASEVVDAALEKFVPSESEEPRRLHAAMRWSLFGGGKRFRPVLLIAVGRHFGAPDAALATTAAAIEMIHTYSLIHDDLPAMDDDDLRRGRATSHKKFDEATAILAGDALQALAFRIIADDSANTEHVRIGLLAGLGAATARMVAGQQMDLSAEGRGLTVDQIEDIHAHKTGALIGFSATAGAIIGNASPEDLDVVRRIGAKLGLLFQISDDLLDVTQPTEKLGKTAGKDDDARKSTYPNLLGIDGTRKLLADVHAQTVAECRALSERSGLLESIAGFITSRES